MEHFSEEHLNKMQEYLKNRLTKEEFIKAFEQVVNLVLKIQKEQGQAISKLETTYGMMMEKMKSDHSMSLSEMKNQVSQHIADYTQQHTNTIAEKMAQVKDGKNADEQMMIENIVSQLKDKVSSVLDKPEEIKAKIETLDEGNKLSIKAIDGLPEALEALKKQVDKMVPFYVGTGTTKGVQVYDLSSQLNGVLKTFALPALSRIVGIQSSSFPNAFRPTVDFTNDAQSITFTSEIDAGSVLATGQTLLVQYVEA